MSTGCTWASRFYFCGFPASSVGSSPKQQPQVGEVFATLLSGDWEASPNPRPVNTLVYGKAENAHVSHYVHTLHLILTSAL